MMHNNCLLLVVKYHSNEVFQLTILRLDHRSRCYCGNHSTNELSQIVGYRVQNEELRQKLAVKKWVEPRTRNAFLTTVYNALIVTNQPPAAENTRRTSLQLQFMKWTKWRTQRGQVGGELIAGVGRAVAPIVCPAVPTATHKVLCLVLIRRSRVTVNMPGVSHQPCACVVALGGPTSPPTHSRILILSHFDT